MPKALAHFSKMNPKRNASMPYLFWTSSTFEAGLSRSIQLRWHSHPKSSLKSLTKFSLLTRIARTPTTRHSMISLSQRFMISTQTPQRTNSSTACQRTSALRATRCKHCTPRHRHIVRSRVSSSTYVRSCIPAHIRSKRGNRNREQLIIGYKKKKFN